MDLFEHRYYRTSKLFLSIIGQWPYQTKHYRNRVFALIVIGFITQYTPQFLAVAKYRNDLDILTECAISLMLTLALTTKMTCAAFNSQKLLTMLDRIRSDWQVWARNREINILHKYAERGRIMATGYAVAVFGVSFVFAAQPILLRIVDITLGNGSQPAQFPFPVDYYHLDMQKYYFYILMYNCPVQAVGIAIPAATDTILFICVQHCCGIFSAVGEKLERIGKYEKSTQVENTRNVLNNTNMNFQHLAWCIDRHNDAIEFSELIERTYTWCLFFTAGLNVLGISLLGYQVLNRADDYAKVWRFIAFLLIDFMHLFMPSHMSQLLMDHSISIRDYIHNANWYRQSPKTQQILQFMIMRCDSPCKLTAGKMATMCAKTYAVLLKTSMSYLTLLRSV